MQNSATVRSTEGPSAFIAQPGVREKVLQELLAQHIPSHTPCLKLEVSSGAAKTYKLDEADVERVCSKFGKVQSVRVFHTVALVLFKDIASAYFAQRILDGRELDEFRAKLVVSWYHNEEDRPALREVQPTTHNAKYTCRFDIQIQNDKEFQVARRLIGAKGCNMKRIVHSCCQGMKGNAHDVIKLRLRGKGSGFKEGPHKVESAEPLHMCVSSKYQDKYQLAVTEIRKLLTQVYREYSEYCRRKGLPVPQLSVKQQEHVSGRQYSE